MSTNKATYEYDSLGRLIKVTFPSGAQNTYEYDALGNRTTVLEIPGTGLTGPSIPTVASLPKRQFGDFKNNSMVLKLSDGRLIGWGECTNGNLANGIDATNTNALAQRLTFDPNTVMPPSGTTIVDFALTNANIYLVMSNGWAYAAGANAYGQLGMSDTVQRFQLKRIDYFVGLKTITKVFAAGSYQATDGGGCAIFMASDYTLYGVGNNLAGNLGLGDTTNRSTPVQMTGIPITPNHAVDVVLSGTNTHFSTYVLMSDGSLLVAGANTLGQLGASSTSNISTFTTAKITGGTPLTNVTAISANGGYSAAVAGNAIALDSSGYCWSTGRNAKGELGIGNTTNKSEFTQIPSFGGPTNPIVKVEIGGGYNSYAYAIRADGKLFTWGYGQQNNLFQNNTTSSVTSPVEATAKPGAAAKVFFPRGNNLGTNAQLILLTTGGILCFAGQSNGQLAIDNTATPGAYKFVPTPEQILIGDEDIVDLFVHGSGTAQRWFILTDLGNLYASGSNTDSVATAGLSSDAMTANVSWYKISFMP